MLRIASRVSIIHEGFHVWSRGTNTAETFSVLHYWRSLKISERLLSLILCRLNLASRCVLLPLDAQLNNFQVVYLFFFPLLTSKVTPTPFLSVSSETSLCLAARDKIFKVCWRKVDKMKMRPDWFQWEQWLNTRLTSQQTVLYLMFQAATAARSKWPGESPTLTHWHVEKL